ncbi:hypothetical protein BDZ45DRAFT_17719 [Acephala macrosclerotiorum]|nr:hypothetical protein BDZ45DRAFT_17719 [Acephala macrosclerotiorum]
MSCGQFQIEVRVDILLILGQADHNMLNIWRSLGLNLFCALSCALFGVLVMRAWAASTAEEYDEMLQILKLGEKARPKIPLHPYTQRLACCFSPSGAQMFLWSYDMIWRALTDTC